MLPVAAGVCVLSAVDVVYSRVSWQRRIRMTLQEVRDEAKQNEGDQVRIRQRRAIARNRLRQLALQNVPRATLVITNPTHFAVALRYVRSEGGAPVLVAKGQDLLALQIRKIAAENQIPLIEDRALARSLYAAVDVNQPIPPEFFAAVANVILMLRKLGNRQVLKSLEV
jgi:flagellar biosynthetic protein FlhB